MSLGVAPLGVLALGELPATAGGGDTALLADDIESTSEVSNPNIGQAHGLTSNSIQSSTELSSPVVGQVHTLLADDIESSSEVSAPNLAEVSATVNNLLADNLESSTEVSTGSLGQIHALLSDDVSSTTAVSTPALAHIHVLTSVDISSTSEVSTPSLVASSVHSLLADNLESATILSFPTLDRSEGGGGSGKKKQRQDSYNTAYKLAKQRKNQREILEKAVAVERQDTPKRLTLKPKPVRDIATPTDVQRIAAIDDDTNRQIAIEFQLDQLNKIDFKRREDEALALLLLIA